MPDTCRGFILCIRYINTKVTKEALCLSSKKLKLYLSISPKGKNIPKDKSSWDLFTGKGEGRPSLALLDKKKLAVKVEQIQKTLCKLEVFLII